MNRRRSLAITVLLAVAVGGFIFAFTRPTDEQRPPTVRDEVVSRLIPARDSLVLRQTEVAIDLDASYTGRLVLHRPGDVGTIHIPDSEHDRIATGFNRVAFTPGPGKVVETFEPGRYCVTAIFWPVTESEDRSRSQHWCFDVH